MCRTTRIRTWTSSSKNCCANRYTMVLDLYFNASCGTYLALAFIITVIPKPHRELIPTTVLVILTELVEDVSGEPDAENLCQFIIIHLAAHKSQILLNTFHIFLVFNVCIYILRTG